MQSRFSMPIITGILLFLGLWGYWGFYYGGLLYLESGYDSLSIPWKGPFSEFCDFSLPASLLTTAGRFISALGQIPLLAGAVLAGLSVWLLFLQIRLWPGRGKYFTSASLITLSSLFFLTELIPYHGYSLFGLVQCSLFFSYFIGLIAASLLTLAVRKITTPKKRFVLSLLLGILLYPLCGFFALLTLFWLLIDFETGICFPAEDAVSSQKRSHFYGFRLMLLAAAVLIPILWNPLFSSHWDGSKIYTAGLFAIGRTPVEKMIFNSQILTLTAIGLMTLPVLFHLFWTYVPAEKQMPSSPELRDSSKRSQQMKKILLLLGVTGFFFALVYCPLHEKAFLAAVRSFRPLEEGNWDKILTLEQKIAQPTEPLIELRRLALLRTGRAVTEYFNRPSFAFYPQSLTLAGTVDIYGASLMFYAGTVNFAERMAMEQFVVTENRSAYCVEMLTLCALVKGNTVLAEKYINWLSRQIGWRGRAKEFQETLNFLKDGGLLNPAEKITPAVLNSFVLPENCSHLEERALFWAKEILRCRLLNPVHNMTNYNDPPSYVTGFAVLGQNWADYPLDWLEMQLICAMQIANLPRFNELFPHYYSRLQKERPGEPIPKTLQEGAMFVEFIAAQQFPPKKYPYDPALLNRFQAMLAASERPEGPGPEFNGTWWKYLFDCRKQSQNNSAQ